VPAVTLGTDLVWQNFLAEDYRVSQQAIDATSIDAAGSDADREERQHGNLHAIPRPCTRLPASPTEKPLLP